MLDKLKVRLAAAVAAVQQAETDVALVTERSPERLATKHLDEKKSELLEAERALQAHELAQFQEQLSVLLARKAALLDSIMRQFRALVPELQALDEIEQQGAALNSRAFALALDTHGALKSTWRDPLLAGVSTLTGNWLRKLEAA